MRRVLFVFLLCAGCSSRPVYKPVTVETPIPVPCRVPAVARPAWPLQALSPDAGILDQVKALLAENEVRQGYEARLEAAMQACQ